MKIRKTQENKAAYLGLSMLDLCRIVMDEFWYDYVKPSVIKKQNFVVLIQRVSKLSISKENLKGHN